MSTTDADTTLWQRAYDALRDGILTGRWHAGQRLSLRAVAGELGMSMAPVGEAFRALARDGLLESESRWGTRVRRMDAESLRSQHVLRTALECEAVRQAARAMLPETASELTRIAEDLDAQVAAGGEPEAIFALDARFHLRLAQASGVPQLVEALRANQLLLLLDRGSRVAHGTVSPPRQHQRLIEAVRTGDPDHAEREMRAHCEHSMQAQLAFFAAHAARALAP